MNTSTPIIAPSLLAADFTQLGTAVVQLEDAGADWLHLDVMDGHFVPNLTFGAPIIKALRPLTKLHFDVHLMVFEPTNLIEDYIDAGADRITIHTEVFPNEMECRMALERIKAFGVKAGISIKPDTPPEAVRKLMPYVDHILIMTVEPGFGGQKFRMDQLPKIQTLAHWARQQKQPIDIAVDGGINTQTIRSAANAGANVFVAGTAVFKGEMAANIIALKNLANPQA